MTKKRLLPSLFLLPAGLLLAAYVAWPLWVTPLAKRLLVNGNVELVSAHISRPGWQQLSVRDLTVRYTAQDYSVTTMVPQLSLSYVWQGLLNGQLNSLQLPIAQLQLQLTGQKTQLEPTIGEPLEIAEWLPGVLFEQLPVADLQVDQLRLSWPEKFGFDDLNGSLHFGNGQLKLQLARSETQPHKLSALAVNLRVDQDNHLQLDVQHDATPVLQVTSVITDGQLNGELTLELSSANALLTQLQLIAEPLQLAGQAKLQWQVPVPEKVTADDWTVAANIQSQLTVDEFKQGDVSVEGVKFSSTGQAQLTPATTRLQFDAGSALQVRQLQGADIRVKKLVATLPTAFELVLQAQRLSIPELVVELPASEIFWQQQAYRFKSSRIKLTELAVDLQQPEQFSSAVELSLTGLDLYGAVDGSSASTFGNNPDDGAVQIKPLNVQGNWQLENHLIKGKVQVSDSAGVMRVRGAMQHNVMSGKGRLTSQLDKLSFKKSQSYLPRLFNRWPYPFDLFAGELAINSLLTWHDAQLNLQSQVILRNISGFYDTNLFHGLNTEIVISGPLDNPTVVADKLTVSHVDVGVAVKNIQFALHANLKAAKIKKFQAELLGGQIGQKRINYDFKQPDNELLLQIRGIQLSQLVSLETGIEGLGTLDGELPVHISATGISLPQGEIKARSPGGFIKYQGAKAMGAAAADVGVGFALQALENFHYERLDANASYSEDGQLKLVTTLQGRNPDMSEQRPVRFNITIQENIPALIESLKLTQHIGDDIERRIQSFYKTKNRQ